MRKVDSKLNSIKSFAPVLIITLNRYHHFIRCVNSLSECKYANKTDLFIAIDYPLSDNHFEGHIKISNYCQFIKGFKSVNIIKRNENFGIIKNYHLAVDYIFEKYDRIIFSEDDNIFSTDFLNFMNQSLETFELSPQIFSVCGYNYPINITPKYNKGFYLWKGHSAWGVGFWKEKFTNIDWSNDRIQSNVKFFLKNYINVLRFNSIANIYIPSLIQMQNVNKIHGDIYICLHQFLNNMTSVFPVESRVRNIGNDGTGEHCTSLAEDIYTKQFIYNGTSNYNIPTVIEQNNEIDNLLKKHFKKSFISKLVIFSKLFLMNIGLYNIFRNLKVKLNE